VIVDYVVKNTVEKAFVTLWSKETERFSLWWKNKEEKIFSNVNA